LLVAAAVVTAFMLDMFSFGGFGGREDDEPDDFHIVLYNGREGNGEETGNNGNGGDNGIEMTEPPPTPTPEPTPVPILTIREQHDKIVWINAGGGGSDVGSEGVLNGVTHFGKNITLDIALKVFEMFENSQSGIKAYMLRGNDVTFPAADRPLMWNDTADMVISIHMNSFTSDDEAVLQSVSGFEVHYDHEHNAFDGTGRYRLSGMQLAEIMRNNMAAQTGARNRGIIGDRGWIVNTASTAPSVMVFAGFMSNPDELEKLLDLRYQWDIARAIYDTVVEAFRFPLN
jgi:N-acetylmuramoyl-L-alanine amidase